AAPVGPHMMPLGRQVQRHWKSSRFNVELSLMSQTARETSIGTELPERHDRIGRFRWVICAVLFLACVVNYMDRQVLGLLKPDLMKILSWTERDYTIIAICFQATYAIGQSLYGPLSERWGVKLTYSFSMIFWSLAAMAHA